MQLEWTLVNLIIQVVAGFAGAHGAAIAAHEHRFGFLGHSLVGLIAGALSGYFLQILAMTAVYGGGYAMPLSKAEAIVIQALTGAVAGGIAMLLIGFVLDGSSSGAISATVLPLMPCRIDHAR